MTTTTMNGAVDVDDLLDSLTMPDDLQAQAAESSCISVQRIVNTIQALAIVAHDLDHLPKLELLHSVDGLIASVPENERGPIETAVNAILKNGADTDKFMQAIPAPAAGPKFKPMSMAELLARPQKQWLIDSVVGAGDLVMVYGASGCGKTHVVIDLIFSACMGSQFARRFPVARRLNVAYAAGEGLSGLAQRFAAVMDHYSYHDPLFDYSNFTFFETVPQLYAGEDAIYSERITDFIVEWKDRQAKGEAQPLDILVIDTLHTATAGADENSAKDMGIVLNLAKRATKELGCAVVLVHHTGKNNETERGSSALRGAMDTMIHIAKLSDNGTKAKMTCAKSKDSEAWQSQTFDLTSHLDSVRVWWDEPSDGTPAKGQKAEDKAAIKAEMERYAGTRFTSKRLAEAIAKSDNYARNLLAELEKAGECKRDLSDPSKGPSPRNPWVYFVDASQKVSAEP